MATRTDIYFRCDRCGAERPCRNPSDHHSAHVTYDIVNSQIGSGSGGKRDLCSECYRDLRKISQNVNASYDSFDSAVVAAETEEAARQTNPDGDRWGDIYSAWCPDPQQVIVEHIGEAAPGIAAGIILASSLRALQELRDIEAELREQASGSQDGYARRVTGMYLLDVANRMRDALKKFAT